MKKEESRVAVTFRACPELAEGSRWRSLPILNTHRDLKVTATRFIFLFALFLLLPSSVLRAKWNIVFTQLSKHGFRAGFFFDEENGFIAGRMDDGVYKTTNGGKTWVVTPIPLTPKGG